MDFVKMQGAGNDFIITWIESWEEADHLQTYAQWLCHRNFGIGADGLITIGPDPEMDVFMRIFNADGSEPEMCGNGIRCVARYAYQLGMTHGKRLSVHTLAGPRYPEIILEDERFFQVKVDMGEPVLERAHIPMDGEGPVVGVQVNIPQQSLMGTAVSMGNPHFVVFVDDVNQIPVSEWGPLLERHAFFPARTNVEFVQVLDEGEMIMRVWERGAGITLACGTGACASLVACVLNHRCGRTAVVHLLGGDLHIHWNEEDNHVYMSGPAEEVFSGQVDLDGMSRFK
ncbi:MAG TPA: diaminopimelate epimerase [Syntrophomonadaceae bacterium]|nr:diaminopimelate epimerase [Syntrophomonadaceae bacterium]